MKHEESRLFLEEAFRPKAQDTQEQPMQCMLSVPSSYPVPLAYTKARRVQPSFNVQERAP